MKLYVPLFSATLLLSALLLFTIQPIFTKMILPYLGGAPQTWNTSILFFQTCLLAGYAYAHGTSRYLNIKTQAALHLILLITFVFILPIAIPEDCTPPAGNDPTLWQIILMVTVVGGPFFVVSCSAPMLQHWFSKTDHINAHNPYFLYSTSNIGSLSGLLLYPLLIEPLMTTSTQSYNWMYGYIALIILTSLCAFLIWKYKESSHNQSNNNEDVKISDDSVTTKQRIKWIILSFIPSTLMLGVTTHITTEIASVPLFWVLPLALYIGTFVIVFARKPLFTSNQIMLASGISVTLLCAQHIAFKDIHNYPITMITLPLGVFFLLSLACHTSLAESRPTAKRLTEFYLIMSFGGALGGFFNAIIVPNYFIVPIEYPLMFAAAVLVRYINVPKHSFSTIIKGLKENTASYISLNNFLIIGFPIVISIIGKIINENSKIEWLCAALFFLSSLLLINRRWAFGLIIIPIMFFSNVIMPKNLIHIDRSFFGVIRINETKKERTLMHGSTTHGSQPKANPLVKVSYYGNTSPASDLFSVIGTGTGALTGKQRVAVMGLGIGVTACYTKEGRHFDFYEIDRKIAEIAENPKFFTYLSNCGSPYDIILGDGRLEIEKKPNEHYDYIMADAFSSDSIPIHLMTKEALEIYLKKLKKGGLLAMNISNRFLDLEPIVTQIGDKIGITTLSKVGIGELNKEVDIHTYSAHFIALTHDIDTINKLKKLGWEPTRNNEGIRAWTDQYSNIIRSLDTTGLKNQIRKYMAKSKQHNLTLTTND